MIQVQLPLACQSKLGKGFSFHVFPGIQEQLQVQAMGSCSFRGSAEQELGVSTCCVDFLTRTSLSLSWI